MLNPVNSTTHRVIPTKERPEQQKDILYVWPLLSPSDLVRFGMAICLATEGMGMGKLLVQVHWRWFTAPWWLRHYPYNPMPAPVGVTVLSWKGDLLLPLWKLRPGDMVTGSHSEWRRTKPPFSQMIWSQLANDSMTPPSADSGGFLRHKSSHVVYNLEPQRFFSLNISVYIHRLWRRLNW